MKAVLNRPYLCKMQVYDYEGCISMDFIQDFGFKAVNGHLIPVLPF